MLTTEHGLQHQVTACLVYHEAVSVSPHVWFDVEFKMTAKTCLGMYSTCAIHIPWFHIYYAGDFPLR